MTGRWHLLDPESELDAIDERVASRLEGCAEIRSITPRTHVRITGVVRSVTYPPVDDAPDLRAHLFDGTGEALLVFRGRREVPGIDPGRRLVAEGTVLGGALPTLVDPRYELRPSIAEVEEIAHARSGRR